MMVMSQASCFVMGMELVGPSKRTLAGILCWWQIIIIMLVNVAIIIIIMIIIIIIMIIIMITLEKKKKGIDLSANERKAFEKMRNENRPKCKNENCKSFQKNKNCKS